MTDGRAAGVGLEFGGQGKQLSCVGRRLDSAKDGEVIGSHFRLGFETAGRKPDDGVKPVERGNDQGEELEEMVALAKMAEFMPENGGQASVSPVRRRAREEN